MPEFLPNTDIQIQPQNDITTPDYIRHKAPVAMTVYDPDEPPLRCVRFNRDYVQYIIAVLDYYCVEDQWEGTLEERRIAVQRFETLRAMFITGSDNCDGSEGMSMLRQNTINPCVLEQSNDGGNTWQTAFDFGKCFRSKRGVTITFSDVDIYNDQSTTNMTTYAGDIVNVAPQWAYGDQDDVWRDMALCWACERWVEICVDLAVQAGQQTAEENQNTMRWIANAIGTLADSLAQLAEMEIFPEEAAIGAVALELTSLILTVVAEFQGFDASKLLDQSAQTAVACEIYSAIAGAKPTYAAWQSALFEHGLIGNEAEIANACYMLMQSEEAFVQYLMIAAQVVPAAELAGDLGCPCDNTWEHWFDLTAAQLPAHITIATGNHVPTLGVRVSAVIVDGITQNLAVVWLNSGIGAYDVRNVYVEYAGVAFGTLSSSLWGILVDGTHAAPPEYLIFANWRRTEIAEGWGSKETSFITSDANSMNVSLRVARGADDGVGYIARIRVRGQGANPYL